MSTAIEMTRYAGDRTMTSKFHEIDVCIQSDQGMAGNSQFEKWLVKESQIKDK